MRILVVDDEQLLVKGMKYNLEREGYQVECANDGATAVSMVKNGAFDLVIMDLMMPEMDGLQACREIRKFSNIPVIMLTAKSEDTDKLKGFECGADDYITKPFNIMEVKARVKALLRRSGGAESEEEKITIGAITLDMKQRIAICNGRVVDLTAREFELLELMMKNPRRIYSRENLMNAVWGYDTQSEYRTVDVHMRRLREKVEENPAEPEYIITKWGVGYYFKG